MEDWLPQPWVSAQDEELVLARKKAIRRNNTYTLMTWMKETRKNKAAMIMIGILILKKFSSFDLALRLGVCVLTSMPCLEVSIVDIASIVGVYKMLACKSHSCSEMNFSASRAAIQPVPEDQSQHNSGITTSRSTHRRW